MLGGWCRSEKDDDGHDFDFDTGDGWLWGNTYGSHYHATTTGGKGYWRCHDNDADDDYSPTFWMALPGPPPDA